MKRKNAYSSMLAVLVFMATGAAFGQNTQVTITDIKSGKGQVILNIYRDSPSYEKQAAFKTLKFEKKGYASGKFTVSFELEPGTYAIALVDDENKDGELNKNLLGIPKEGFGFSDFFMEKMKKPSFEDFKVTIAPKDNKILIRARYM